MKSNRITSAGHSSNTFVGSRYLTVRHLYDACQNNSYLLLRFASGYQMGVNCRVAAIAQRLNPKEWEQETDFVSYKPCGINEYIEHKHPFKPTAQALPLCGVKQLITTKYSKDE